MWEIILLMVVFEGSELRQVVEPLPGTRFETEEACHRVGTKLEAYELPAGYHAKHLCIAP